MLMEILVHQFRLKYNNNSNNAMKSIYFLSVLFLISYNESNMYENKTNQYIQWSKNVKLSWNDFGGQHVPDSLAHHHAVTWVTSKWVNYKVYTDSITTDLVCYFIVNKSWKSKNISEELLNHEQRHFDLAEIITRQMRQELSTHISINNDSTVYYINYISDKYTKERRNIMNKYDFETNHGVIREAQKKWDIKIDQMLDELEPYSNPHIVIKKGR